MYSPKSLKSIKRKIKRTLISMKRMMKKEQRKMISVCEYIILFDVIAE